VNTWPLALFLWSKVQGNNGKLRTQISGVAHPVSAQGNAAGVYILPRGEPAGYRDSVPSTRSH
jgi:hypothetical protein